MKIFRYYIIIYFSDLLFIYGALMVSIVRTVDLESDAYKYSLLCVIGAFLTLRYSFKMRQKGKLKSIYFSIFELISILVMCLYYFNNYEINIFTIDFLSLENIILFFLLASFIYKEYNFYFSPLGELEKNFKKWVF